MPDQAADSKHSGHRFSVAQGRVNIFTSLLDFQPARLFSCSSDDDLPNSMLSELPDFSVPLPVEVIKTVYYT